MTTEAGCNTCDWQETFQGNPVQSNAEAKNAQMNHVCENPDTYRKDIEN